MIASALLCSLAFPGTGSEALDGWQLSSSWNPSAEMAALRFVEVDGDPGQELLSVQADGRVQLLEADAEGEWSPIGEPLRLPEPSRSLLNLSDLLGRGRPQLVVLDGKGLRLHELGPEGCGEGLSLARRARLTPRTGVPSFADFVRPLGGDPDAAGGLPDVIVPAPYACSVWRLEAPAPAGDDSAAPELPRARKVAELRSRHVSRRDFGAERLSDLLSSTLVIPDLATEDVNGDGRQDLVLRSGDQRAYYLQREGGLFEAEPDVEIDLEIFKDTSPKAEIRPGEIATDDDIRSDSREDLDGDGIPDHVIAHRRKVWVFHGDENGPQYSEPSTVLKVAEDVTGLLVVPIDEDDRPDLVLLKIEVPTITEVIVGVLASWDVRMRVIGYRNEDGRSFATKPTWRVEHSLTLPPILDLVRKPESFFSDFENLRASVRAAARGDWDGDGSLDLILAKAEEKDDDPTLHLWFGRGGAADKEPEDEGAPVRELLFETENTSWSLERLASTVASLAGARLDAMTGGQEPDTSSATDPDWILENLVATDIDGDGRDELAVLYADPDRARRVRLDFLEPPK